MALFEFFRRMIFGTDLSPKKIILKGADLLDPYMTQFQFKVELENALMSVYAHPKQAGELRQSLAIASMPLPAVHDFVQAALRQKDTIQLGEAAIKALDKLKADLNETEDEMAAGIQAAWLSLVEKMASEKSKLSVINDWLSKARISLS